MIDHLIKVQLGYMEINVSMNLVEIFEIVLIEVEIVENFGIVGIIVKEMDFEVLIKVVNFLVVEHGNLVGGVCYHEIVDVYKNFVIGIVIDGIIVILVFNVVKTIDFVVNVKLKVIVVINKEDDFIIIKKVFYEIEINIIIGLNEVEIIFIEDYKSKDLIEDYEMNFKIDELKVVIMVIIKIDQKGYYFN